MIVKMIFYRIFNFYVLLWFLWYFGKARSLAHAHDSNPHLPDSVFQNDDSDDAGKSIITIPRVRSALRALVDDTEGSGMAGHCSKITSNGTFVKEAIQGEILTTANSTLEPSNTISILRTRRQVPLVVESIKNVVEFEPGPGTLEPLVPEMIPTVRGMNTVSKKRSINGGPGTPHSKASDGSMCNVLTIIRHLVNTVLQFVFHLREKLIDSIIDLSKGMFRSVFQRSLPDLLNVMKQWLSTLLSDIFNDIAQIVNTTLTDLLGKNLINIAVANITSLVELQEDSADHKNLIKAVSGVVLNIENLLKSLLVQPHLDENQFFANVSILLNSTFENLLGDFDKLATDLVTDSSHSLSLVVELTTDVTYLLKVFLGEVCNVEQVSTNSNSMAELIRNLIKIIKGSLENVLKGANGLSVDVLKKLLVDNGLKDGLLDGILKLLSEPLLNLLLPNLSKLKNSPPLNNWEQFRKLESENIRNSIAEKIILPGVSGIDPVVDFLLNALINSINDLKQVEDLLANITERLRNSLKKLLKPLNNLLDNLMNELSKEMPTLLGSQSSYLIDLHAQFGPLETSVTNILKQLVCNFCKKVTPAITTNLPATHCQPRTTPKPKCNHKQNTSPSKNSSELLEIFGTLLTDFWKPPVKKVLPSVTTKHPATTKPIITTKPKCNHKQNTSPSKNSSELLEIFGAQLTNFWKPPVKKVLN